MSVCDATTLHTLISRATVTEMAAWLMTKAEADGSSTIDDPSFFGGRGWWHIDFFFLFFFCFFLFFFFLLCLFHFCDACKARLALGLLSGSVCSHLVDALFVTDTLAVGILCEVEADAVCRQTEYARLRVVLEICKFLGVCK